MKPVPAGFTDFLLTQQRMLLGELYTFTLRDGTEDYFTNLDFSVLYNSHTFKGNSLRIEGLKYKIGVGWQVDEQEISITAFPGETLAGASLFEAVESGLLDGAYFTRQRVFWTISDGRPWVDYAALPQAVITIFTGRISTIDKVGRTRIQAKIKSPLSLLDIDMPKNSYGAGCQWALFDAGCTLSKAAFEDSGFVISGVPDARTLEITGSFPHGTNGGDGLPYYAQGRLKFTTGTATGLQVSVASNAVVTGVSIFYLTYPLADLPSPGDIFSAWPGCSKLGRGGACELKFSNLDNFRGFPRVPPIVVSV